MNDLVSGRVKQWFQVGNKPGSVLSGTFEDCIGVDYDREYAIKCEHGQLHSTRKIATLRAAFSSSCGGLQPSPANSGALRAQQ